MQEFTAFLQENLLLSVLWVGLAAALIASIIKEKTSPYKFLSPSDATLLVNRHEGVFVDVRSRDDFRSGHITDAINLAAKEIKDNNLSVIENLKSTPIILICKTGQTAIESAQALAKAGFENINVLKDGLISWNEANLPLVRNKKKKNAS